MNTYCSDASIGTCHPPPQTHILTPDRRSYDHPIAASVIDRLWLPLQPPGPFLVCLPKLSRIPSAWEKVRSIQTKCRLDTDNDLLVLNEGITPAVGEVAYISGRVLTKSGEPLRNGYVEIWQTDINGSYLHSGGRNTGGYDSNFQGYGRFITDSKGHYFFRTIRPVEYTLQGAFRCPHIHVAVSKSGHRLIATQMLIKGHPANERDGIVTRNRAKGEMLESVMVDFKPMAGSKLKEYSANWDIVIGRTAQEMEDGTLGIGLGRPDRPKFNPPNAKK